MKRILCSGLLAFTLICFYPSFCYSQYTNVYSFDSTNGSYPCSHLYYDGIYLYGTTYDGGTNDMGTIYKIMPDGTGYIKLLDFAGVSNGMNTNAGLISDGTFLYGVTRYGGINNNGTIFKIMPDGTGFMKLLDMDNDSTGMNPYGSLFYDGTFLYGTTLYGGTYGLGTIFKIMPDGSNFSKLVDFGATITGGMPASSLMTDGTYLYGTTYLGGASGMGTIYKIMPNGTGFTTLFEFDGTPTGRRPYSSLIFDGTYLYGMTSQGGTSDSGVVYKIKPDGTAYMKLLDFDGVNNGGSPIGCLNYSNSFLYGLTYLGGASNKGVAFQIMPDGTGFTKLLDFTGTVNGSQPNGSFISDGTYLYGTTSRGGATNHGTIFKYQYSSIGIEENNSENYLHVYPNPTIGKINVSCKVSISDGILELTNMLGQPIQVSKNINLQSGENYVIDLSSYSDGSYILKLNGFKVTLIKN